MATATNGKNPQESAPAMPELSPKQTATLQALLAGHNQKEAAKIARVSESQVSRWMNDDDDFREALGYQRQLQFGLERLAWRDIRWEAMSALRPMLESYMGGPDFKLKLIDYILTRTDTLPPAYDDDDTDDDEQEQGDAA